MLEKTWFFKVMCNLLQYSLYLLMYGLIALLKVGGRMKKDDKLFSASEVGQFTFCSVSWFLQRLGYRAPFSKKRSHGMKIHDEIGRKTRLFPLLLRLSHLLIGCGVLIIILLFIFDILGVIGG